jgi:transcriptional regulator with XRE-family HTH domain
MTEDNSLVLLLKETMRRRQRKPSQLAADIGVSHATVSRWLSGKDIPSTKSCCKLAEYSGMPLQEFLIAAGHIFRTSEIAPRGWPEFREYAQQKYPAELDEDTINMIEELIERRRVKKYGEEGDEPLGLGASGVDHERFRAANPHLLSPSS